MPLEKPRNDGSALASEAGVRKMCGFHNFRALLGLLLSVAAATLPWIWLFSAKSNLSLTNHMFAGLPTVPIASIPPSPSLMETQHPTGSPSWEKLRFALCPPSHAFPTPFPRLSGSMHVAITWGHISNPESWQQPYPISPAAARLAGALLGSHSHLVRHVSLGGKGWVCPSQFRT